VSADHHIAIDGTLKEDTSEVNDLLAFSYKAKSRGHQDIYVLYAYDIELFGVIVFESDQDMPPETAYLCYDDRWLLELVFKRYKSDECFVRTNVQGDFSVIGSEFINFISTLVTCCIIRKTRATGLLKKMTYGEMMDDLSSAWRMADAPSPPKSGDGFGS